MSVLSVSKSPSHHVSKQPSPYIFLIKDRGVEDDIHCNPPRGPGCGAGHIPEDKKLKTPLSYQAKTNYRQVHLIEAELFQTLSKPDKYGNSFNNIFAGTLGENITTFGIKLTEISIGSKLHFLPNPNHCDKENDNGSGKVGGAVIRVTGMRYAGKKMEKEIGPGIIARFVIRNNRDHIIGHKPVGLMGVVEKEGYIMMGQLIRVELPSWE